MPEYLAVHARAGVLYIYVYIPVGTARFIAVVWQAIRTIYDFSIDRQNSAIRHRIASIDAKVEKGIL